MSLQRIGAKGLGRFSGGHTAPRRSRTADGLSNAILDNPRFTSVVADPGGQDPLHGVGQAIRPRVRQLDHGSS